jgi:transposase-like protein
MAAHRSISERRALVADWLESDLATADFADSRRVSPSSLHRWRRQLESGEDDPAPAGFVELFAASPHPARPADAPIQIRLANASILIWPGADRATLATVLAALRPAS